MLVLDQHLYKRPAIEVNGHWRLLIPWLKVLCWFFCNSWLKNCWLGLGIEPTNSKMRKQSLRIVSNPSTDLTSMGSWIFRLIKLANHASSPNQVGQLWTNIQTPTPEPYWLKGGNMPCRVRKWETCFEVGVGWIRLG